MLKMICVPGSLFALGHILKRHGLADGDAKKASEAVLSAALSDHVPLPRNTVRTWADTLEALDDPTARVVSLSMREILGS